MPLSWNEIKNRATSFSNEWKDTKREEADAKPFLINFLNIFGISQKRVATFEHRVKKIDDASGYIDLLWPGTLLVEMKSRGQDLEKAYTQAKNYCHGLKEHELPKLIMICDFHYFHIYREDGLNIKFELSELLDNLQIFEELAGYQKRTYHEEDPVNIAAAELMGKLHDQLKNVGYTGTALEAYLVRLLFILFADDTTIFQKGIFFDYLEQRTKEDGSDLAMHIDQIFQVLDIPEDKRLTTLDEQLNLFPYVNGSLFSERLPTAAFNSKMRQILLDCCKLDWGKISPAIFGSLFQSVMDAGERRNLGAHYTSEKNIMKLIKPLFLDELWDEFHTAGENHNKLRALHGKISKLRFLDPACGCGNFLITSYKELRLLELAIVDKLLKGQMVTNVSQYFLVDLDQFYGIEIGEFPSQIAQVAMFLIDHQMNMLVSDKFGEYIPLIPLKKSAVIVNDNALRLDWQSIVKPLEGETNSPKYHYILGNPPFVGSKWMSEEQRADMAIACKGIDNYGILDFVTGWYFKSRQYQRLFPDVRAAFVSTNSITQGEQVGPLWTSILQDGCVIQFGYRTFQWKNEAKGLAAVHCVIIGFGINQSIPRLLFYEENGVTVNERLNNITPYLTSGKTVFIWNRSKPICNVPIMSTGNKPIDGGIYIFSLNEKEDFLSKEPLAAPYILPFLGAEEFINCKERYILYLKNISPVDLKKMPLVMDRVRKVKEFRMASSSKPTLKLAETPTLFHTDNMPNESFLVIPQVSSERRKYIPIGYLKPPIVCSDKLRILPNSSLYSFGVLTSIMHMVWMKTVTGRLKSDFQYSVLTVYNNFPWPENTSDEQKKSVEEAAQSILDIRAQFQDSSLADLYDPNTMPPLLVKAHQALDKVVDHCYRPQPFTKEAKRIEFLFELYEKYTTGLFVEKKTKKK
jgi:hypothetical protein